MFKKRKKSISFDAMVKFFLQYYGIPTKEDVKRIISRIDQMEEVIIRQMGNENYSRKKDKTLSRIRKGTAAHQVLEIIKNSENGIGFSEIQEICKFDEKKLRNVIFRLNDLGYITRVSRGIYIAVSENSG